MAMVIDVVELLDQSAQGNGSADLATSCKAKLWRKSLKSRTLGRMELHGDIHSPHKSPILNTRGAMCTKRDHVQDHGIPFELESLLYEFHVIDGIVKLLKV